MNKTVKEVLSNTFQSIGYAAVIFCVVGVIFDLIFKGNLVRENYTYTRMAAGMFVIGIGFGVPTLVYKNEKIPLPVQGLIHMGIGCVVMTIAAFAVGWIPTDRGIGAVLWTILGEIAIALVIWFIIYLHQKKLAKEMNRRISQMK